MSDKIRGLLEQMQALEEQLVTALNQRDVELTYRIEGAKVVFEHAVEHAHRELKSGLIRWLRTSQLQNVLSAPFIYGMFVPFLLLDLCLSLYQATCFRLYGIAAVSRSRYIVVDRHQLAYLNSAEKLNCAYCGYANGLIAYAREIASRTEQYWCPIKHARMVLGTHSRYARFLEYGDAADYEGKLASFRATLAEEAARDR